MNIHKVKSWPCTLIQADYCMNSPLLLRLPVTDKPVDLVFADPPYNLGVAYDGDPTKDKMSPEDYKRFTYLSILAMANVCRPGATFWWMTTEEHADWTGQMLNDLVGPRLHRIVWHEAFAQYQGDRALTKDYRFIFCHAVRPQVETVKDWGKDLLTFNPHAIRVPSVRQRMGDKRANPKGRVPGTTWEFNPEASIEETSATLVAHMATAQVMGRTAGEQRDLVTQALRVVQKQGPVPGDVWNFRRLQGTSKDHVKWHPCQLPPELLTRIVKGWSNEGDVILDGFAGSGSLAKVCRSLKREFIGVDRSETYIKEMSKELK